MPFVENNNRLLKTQLYGQYFVSEKAGACYLYAADVEGSEPTYIHRGRNVLQKDKNV